MHAKSGLRVVLKWKIYRPDSVNAAVIRLLLTCKIAETIAMSDLAVDNVTPDGLLAGAGQADRRITTRCTRSRGPRGFWKQ